MKSSLLKSFITYGIGNVLFTLVNLVLVPVYLEKISINDYGILSVFLVTSNLIMLFFSISISNGILRAFNEGFTKEKERIWITTIILFFVVFGVLLSVLSVLFKEEFSKIIFNDIKYGKLFVICVLVGFSRIFFSIVTGVLRARNEAVKYVILNLLNVISLAGINIYVIYFTDYTLLSVAWGYLINGIFSLIVGLIFIDKDIKIGFQTDGLIYFIKYGAPLGLASVASYFINYGNRYYLINYTTGTEVSLMDVAQKISSVVGILLTNAFITAFTPYYLDLYLKVSFEEFSKKMNQVIVIFSTFYCFMGLGLVLFQNLGLSLLSNKEYLIAAEYVPYLILSNFFNVLFMMLTMGTNIQKRTNVEMYITMTILIVSIAANIILIKSLGIYGAIYTQLLINILSIVLIIFYNRKNFPISINYFKILQTIIVFIIIVYAYNKLPVLFNINNKIIIGVVFPVVLILIFCMIFYKTLISLKSNLTSLMLKKI